MKAYATLNVARMQAGVLTKKTGEKHLVMEHDGQFHIGTEEELAKLVAPKKTKRREEVEVEVTYFGQDEKYLSTEDQFGRKIRLALSRVVVVALEEGKALIKTTKRYAAHRFLNLG